MVKLFFTGMKKGMGVFGQNIAHLVNSILLAFVYIVSVGPTAFIARIVGKKFLQTKLSSKKSYWAPLNLKKEKLDNYYRQF